MEITFNLGRYWQSCGRNYEPVTSRKVLKNVFVESENSDARLKVMLELLKQMEEQFSPFSELFINLNPRVECPKNFTSSFIYGSPEFTLPYYLEIEGYSHQYFSKCFSAILNFHFELRIIMNLISSDCKKRGFPPSLIDFLALMRTDLQKNPYDNEFTTSLINNINDAIDLLERDTDLEQTLRVGTSLPDWLRFWRKKQKVWIDLSGCKPDVQKMLVPVIFLNLLRSTDYYGARENYWRLNGVVILNNIDEIFAPVPWEQYTARYNQRSENV